MSLRITDACIACGDCLVACSQEAILETDSPSKRGEGDRRSSVGYAGGHTVPGPASWLSPFYYISGGCNQCGSCIEVCPAGAIVWDTRVQKLEDR